MIVVAALVGYVFWFSPLLAVRNVRLIGANRFGGGQLQAITAKDIGTPLARVDTAGVAHRVEQNPAVASAQAVRAWPSTLEVRVTERVPVVAVPVLGAADGVDAAGASAASSAAGAKGTKVSSVQLMAADGVVIETEPTAPPGCPWRPPTRWRQARPR